MKTIGEAIGAGCFGCYGSIILIVAFLAALSVVGYARKQGERQ